MVHRSLVKASIVSALALGAAAILAAQAASLKTPASLTEAAPATYNAKFDTSAGVFVISVTKAWAPKGEIGRAHV